MAVRNLSRHARRRLVGAVASVSRPARMETLEPRKLLTTIAGNDVVEFIDASGTTQRVRFTGNGLIELVGVAFDFQNEPIIHNIPLSVIERGGNAVNIDLFGGRGGTDGVDPLDQIYFDINGVPFQIAEDASISIDGSGLPAGGPVLGPGSDDNQVRAVAANSRGRVWGFNVSQIPNPDPDIDEDITVAALLNFDYRGTGDGLAFADLAPLITGGTEDETNNLKDIISADFSPSNPNKLYFVAIVTESITGENDQKIEVDFPVLYLYNLADANPATALTRLGRFRTSSTPTQNTVPDVAGISFTDDGELVAYVTAKRGGQTVVERSGFVTLAVQEPGDIAPGEPSARFSFNNVLRTRINTDNDELTDVTDIEIISNDGGNIYVVADTDLWRVNLNDGKAQLYGSLLDPDDEDAEDQRGAEIGAITWVPTVPNPLRLQDANPGNDNQKGILIGTDTAKDEFIILEPAVRPPESNLFSLYIAGTDENSHVSIAAVDDFNPDDPEPRPMLPFDGGPGTIRVADFVFGAADTAEGHRTVTPAGGASFLGARTIDVIDNTAREEDVPVRRLRRPNNLDLGIVPEQKFLYAGLEVVGPIGRFYFGGTITGRVYLGGNTEQFYAGSVLTGIPSGRWGVTSLAGTVLVDRAEQYEDVRRNFFVNGDLRNFATFDAVGGVTGSTEQNNFDYASGFDMYVKGRLGQIKSRRNIVGAIKVENNTRIDTNGDAQRELEYFGSLLDSDTTGETYFEGNHFVFPYSGVPTLGDLRVGQQAAADDFSNDVFETPEILSTALAAGFDSDEVIVLDGILRGGDGSGEGADDGVDYFGVGLVAGQRITVDIDVVGTANVGVFDPDGRLIATDYSNNDFASNNNQPFAFQVDRPGLYRIAVARAGDGNFNDALDDGESITSTSNTFYRLFVTGKLADIALGGVSAGTPATNADFIGFLSDFNPVAVLNGDLGAILASGSIGGGVLDGNRPVTALPDAIYIERGNLRSVEARDLGFYNDAGSATGYAPGTGPDFILPKGVIGGIRANRLDSAVLAMNDDGIITDTNQAAALRYAPVDVQLVEASGTNTDFTGNIVARRRIGVIRVREMDNIIEARGAASTGVPGSGVIVPPPIIAANVDGRDNDGVIDLIDVVGDMGGLLTGGGPALSAGPGGNIRYVNVGGNAFRDRFFGGGAPETIVGEVDTPVDLVDDSGTAYRITPILANSNPPVFGQPVNNNRDVSGVISVLALPVRNSLSGGRSGLVAIGVNTTTGMTIESRARGTRGSVEIGGISTTATNGKPIIEGPAGIPSQPPGAGLVDINFTMTGNVPVDVFSITGQNFTEISNTTRGEILNVAANDIGSLIGYNLGVGKSSTGALVNPLNVNANLGAAPVSVYPFLEQTFGIATAGSILSLRARGAVGNVAASGSIDSISANADNRNDKGVFEGIVGPIVSFRTVGTLNNYGIRNVNIGEGILPSGTGAVAFAGLYSILRMGTITNQGLGSDVRGDIHSQTRIDAINLTDGAIINSDVLVTADFIDSQEYPRAFATPEVFALEGDPFEIGAVNINGVGGVIGGYLAAADVGTITINRGFGVMQTLITAVGDGIIGGIITDGFGIRSTTINGGSTVQNLVARGDGTRLPTTAYTSSVRQSENGTFDPFFLSAPTRLTDLHAFLGTTKKAPKRKGWSNAGVIDSVVAAASRDLEQVRAWAIQNRFNSGAVGTTDDAYPMRFSFGRDVLDLRVTESIDGLAISAGNIRFFTTGGDVLKSTIAASGLIDSMTIGGNLRGTAEILTDGPDGQINGLNVKGALFGRVNSTVRIGTLTVGTDLGSPFVSSSNAIGTATIGRNILSGATLRAKNRIDNLIVGNDIQVDAVVASKAIGNQQIGGDVFGEIRIG